MVLIDNRFYIILNIKKKNEISVLIQKKTITGVSLFWLLEIVVGGQENVERRGVAKVLDRSLSAFYQVKLILFKKNCMLFNLFV